MSTERPVATNAPPSDVFAPRFPVSIKAVLEVDGAIVLLRNDRDEWELPGGKLEAGEDPVRCLERELFEELNVRATVTELLNVWVYDIEGRIEVFIVTFATRPLPADAALRISVEHRELGLFPPGAVPTLNMPAGYKAAVALYCAAAERRRG
jgi:8-oxo-dGTP pyrophosphatase MutT (NUDIX family)